MKKLLVYLKGYEKETVLAPLFKMLEALFELFVPLVMAAVIDVGIGGHDRGYVIRMCLVLIALGVIGLACSITAQYFAAKAATGFSTVLRRELFAHIQSLSYTEMDNLGTSTLITRMTSDINQVQSGVNLVLRLFLRSPFIVFGAMIMAFTVDVKAAMIFVVAIPMLSVVVFGIMIWTMPLYRRVQGALDKVLGMTRENLTGVRVIRAFCLEEQEQTHFREKNERLTDMQKFVGKISGLMNPLTYIIVNGAVVVLLHTGAIRVDQGIITTGAVVALVNYMNQILVELVKLANLIINITKSVACGNRIQSVLEIPSSMKNGSDTNLARADEVVFDHVGLTYAQAGTESLTDIDFSAKAGQTIGIIGGTGSGKSSLVNLIPRFYDATAGAVKINGKNVKDFDLETLREMVGIVPQKAVLFKGTIEDNLRWGKKDATEEELWEALETAQAAEFVRERADGLQAKIDQGGKNLSGGQRQRLTIARALVGHPGILILDDSTSAVDTATDAKIRRAFREEIPDTTKLIIAQRVSSVQDADRIIVMDEGQVHGFGTHEELLKTDEIYREVYESQTQGGGDFDENGGEA